tara:strand:+ start:1533 stop:2465 length:933 start_codon:yes stop_codon:yes gene_type:complete
MKIQKFIIVGVGATIFYAIFLFMSDFNLVSEKISNFNIIFLPIILFLVPLSWLATFFRWHLLLKNSDIQIPIKNSFGIYISGLGLSITPGQVGELVKSHLLKKQFKIPITKSAPIILIEKFYDLVGAMVASILGIWYFENGSYLILFGLFLLGIIFAFISSRKLFNKLIKIVTKIKFFKNYEENFTHSYDVLNNSRRGKIGFISSVLSICYWIINGLIVFCILIALDITNVNFLIATSTYSLSGIIGALSFIPGGIGVTESSITGLFSLHGVEFNTGIILGVLIRFFTLWISVFVGFICLKLVGGFLIKD